jgi:hypothetical protein
MILVFQTIKIIFIQLIIKGPAMTDKEYRKTVKEISDIKKELAAMNKRFGKIDRRIESSELLSLDEVFCSSCGNIVKV